MAMLKVLHLKISGTDPRWFQEEIEIECNKAGTMTLRITTFSIMALSL
jgi:hypothetical protein